MKPQMKYRIMQGIHCLLWLKSSTQIWPLRIYIEPSQVYCTISGGRIHQNAKSLSLKRQEKNASENVVCRSRLQQITAYHCWRIEYRSKQCGPRTDCSYRSSPIWIHTVYHRGFLNISADEKSRRLLLRLEH